MKNVNTMEKTIRLLKGHYYGNIILLATIFLLAISSLIPFFANGEVISVTTERYAIMISIIAIPSSLKFFAHQLKKMPRPAETKRATEKYKNASFMRLYTISAVTLTHIILFILSRNMNFFWFTVVLFIVFLFCKPSYQELENLTETPAKQGSPGKEEEQQRQEEQLHPNLSYGDHSRIDDGKAGEKQGKRFEDREDIAEPIQYKYPENEQVPGK
ncbi:hypothetical protein [Proteiniphilum sp. X52]|uniref:hypothetical protein n=1 Tax=Proteiniphilum sp. X52 TaxID=2382159 RepID=UPI000F09B3D6|nr:hypothetical protein [Proteiniphilum sp. X52]RNC66917.1 hypothetical protein D7D25_01255 [Proteiniphilum sp. X52]